MTQDQLIQITISAGIGALIAGIFLLINSWLSRQNEDRRHRRELALKAAISNWERDTDFAILKSKTEHVKINIAPLDMYIIHMLKISEIIERRDLTADLLISELSKIRAITHAAYKNTEREQGDG